MKIKFLGVGSAFTTSEYYQSNMLITAQSGKKILIDCGSDIRFSMSECGIRESDLIREIDAVYISHLHSDHIGGMEWLAFSTYFGPSTAKLKLFMEGSLMQEMWERSLKGGLGLIVGKLMHISDYFDCRPTIDHNTFVWEEMQFTLLKMPHITLGLSGHFSYGLFVEETIKNRQLSVLITTDTQFRPDLLAGFLEKADLVFHDCETASEKTSVHAHYEDLCTLLPSLREKIWLYHYQPRPAYQPKADGFKGFVEKGQEFILE